MSDETEDCGPMRAQGAYLGNMSNAQYQRSLGAINQLSPADLQAQQAHAEAYRRAEEARQREYMRDERERQEAARADQLRAAALEASLRHNGSASPASDVVATAKTFESFLRGETQ